MPLRRGLLACAASFCVFCSRPASAQLGTVPVRSLLEKRQERTVQQGFDLSCGAAALATLLTYEHGDGTSERAVIEGILQRSDPERIRSRGGFSLLDLKRFALSKGYQAFGYGDLRLEDLGDLAPAITPIHLGDYSHFVIVHGMVSDRMLLSDPGYGQRTVSRRVFLRLWRQRIAFVVEKDGARASAPAPPVFTPPVPASFVRHLLGTAR